MPLTICFGEKSELILALLKELGYLLLHAAGDGDAA
jgi:hypothetical protein